MVSASDVIRRASSFRESLAKDGVAVLLARSEAPLYLALIEAVFVPLNAPVRADELEQRVCGLVEDMPLEEYGDYFRGEGKPAERVFCELAGYVSKGGYGWVTKEVNDDDKLWYYRVSDSALSAREYVKSSRAHEAFNSVITESYRGTLGRAAAIVDGADSERDYWERQMREAQARLDGLSERGEQDRADELWGVLGMAIQLASPLSASVREMSGSMRRDVAGMLESVRTGALTPAAAMQAEDDAWTRRFGSRQLSDALTSDAERILGAGPLDELCRRVETDHALGELIGPALCELGGIHDDLRMALRDWRVSLGERNRARDKIRRISYNPEYRRVVEESRWHLEAFSWYVRHIHKGGNTAVAVDGERLALPCTGALVEGFCYEANLDEGTCVSEPSPAAVPPSHEELEARLEFLRRMGSPNGGRAATVVAGHVVWCGEGLVDVPASFASAGRLALCQDIVPLALRFGARGSPERVAWRATNAAGEAIEFWGPAARARIEDVLEMAGGHDD